MVADRAADQGAALMSHPDLREKLIQAGNVLVNEGQDDFTPAAISRPPAGQPALFLMKPHSVGLTNSPPTTS